MLSSALHYATLGFRLFPCHGYNRSNPSLCSCGRADCLSPGKHPLIKEWQTRATTQPQVIQRWWARWPDANIAIATGNGLIVVDLDNADEAARFAALGVLPPTATVKTGRGVHVYLRGDIGASRKIDSILVRGDGGYVIAPPSFHVKSGTRYAWNDTSPVAEAPGWLYAWAIQHKNRQGGLGELPAYLPILNDCSAVNAFRANTPKWTKGQEQKIEEALAVIHPSAKRDIWLQIGMALHSLDWIRSDGTDWGYDKWLEWSQQSVDKFIGEHDCETRWKSFKGGSISIGTLFHYANEYEVNPKSFFNPTDHPQLENPEDGTVNGQINGQINGHEINGYQVNGHKIDPAFVNFGQDNQIWTFDPGDPPKRDWLYRSHYIRQHVSVTVAPGGMGKTSLKLVEAISMAIGRDLLNNNAPIKRSRVFYWTGEDNLTEFQRRVTVIAKQYQLTKEDWKDHLLIISRHELPICFAIENKGQLVFSEAEFEKIKIIANRINPDVLIFDPLVAIHQLPENNNSLMDALIKRIDKFAEEANCAIDVAHHSRKLGSNEVEVTADAARGASAIVNAARACEVLNNMTKGEASRIGIAEDQAWRYVRIDDAKRNFAPAAKARWICLESVLTPNGDNVQVAIDWKFPDFAPAEKDLQILQDLAAKGAYRADSRSELYIGRAFAEATGRDSRHDQDTITKIIKHAKERSYIKIVTRINGARQPKTFVEKGDMPVVMG